jgi:hypothetical protein
MSGRASAKQGNVLAAGLMKIVFLADNPVLENQPEGEPFSPNEASFNVEHHAYRREHIGTILPPFGGVLD